MKAATRAKWLLEGKSCESCSNRFTCKKDKEILLVCGSYIKDYFIDGLKLVRLKYPKIIRGDIISVNPSEKPKNISYKLSINYNNNLSLDTEE